MPLCSSTELCADCWLHSLDGANPCRSLWQELLRDESDVGKTMSILTAAKCLSSASSAREFLPLCASGFHHHREAAHDVSVYLTKIATSKYTSRLSTRLEEEIRARSRLSSNTSQGCSLIDRSTRLLRVLTRTGQSGQPGARGCSNKPIEDVERETHPKV